MGYESKFIGKATRNPLGFEKATYDHYGFGPRGVNTVVRIASKLSAPGGAKMSEQDCFDLQALGSDPRAIALLYSKVNAAPPSQRAALYNAAVVGDWDGAARGDYVDANANFREAEALTVAYTAAEYADAVAAKLGGTRASPAWRPEPGSVRDLLNRATTPKAQRDMQQAFEAGDPNAEHFVAQRLADHVEDAYERLHQPEASLHDSLAAAFDVSQDRAFASEELGIEAPGADT